MGSQQWVSVGLSVRLGREVPPAFRCPGREHASWREECWEDFFFFFKVYLFFKLEYKVVLVVKNPPVNTGDIKVAGSTPRSARSPGGGHGNHSSLLAWRMPWTEEPGGLQSMGSHRVGCD